LCLVLRLRREILGWKAVNETICYVIVGRCVNSLSRLMNPFFDGRASGFMRYGMMNSPLLGVEKEISAVASMGFEYLELTMDAPYADHRNLLSHKDDIISSLQQHDLGLVCHLPTFVSLADLTESIRKASLEETLASMKAAKELGCEKVVLHPWFLSGLGPMLPEMAAQFGKESLVVLLDHACDIGISVCLENLFPKAESLVRPEDFTEWFALYPELRLTLDTGHANLAGGTRTILSFIERYGDRLGHVHVSDNRGRSDDHLPIGAGNIDFPAVVAALKATGYDQTVTFEVFTGDRSYVRHCREKFEESWNNS